MRLYDDGYRGKLTPQRVAGILKRAGFVHVNQSPTRTGFAVSVIAGHWQNQHSDYEAKVSFCDYRPAREWNPTEGAELLARYADALQAAGLQVAAEATLIRCWQESEVSCG